MCKLCHAFNAGCEDLRILQRLRADGIAFDAFRKAGDGGVEKCHPAYQLLQVPRFVVVTFVEHSEIAYEALPERMQQVDDGNVPLWGPELRFHKTVRRLLERLLFRLFDLKQRCEVTFR